MAPRRRGSWPVIAALVVVFLAAFWLQRQRSSFLRIEGERAAAERLASEHHIGLADAFALRDLVGVDAPADRWHEAAVRFHAERTRLGDALAAVAIAGHAAAAERALAAAGDPGRAWEAFRTDVRAVAGLRFVAMRERFAERITAGD